MRELSVQLKLFQLEQVKQNNNNNTNRSFATSTTRARRPFPAIGKLGQDKLLGGARMSQPLIEHLLDYATRTRQVGLHCVQK